MVIGVIPYCGSRASHLLVLYHLSCGQSLISSCVFIQSSFVSQCLSLFTQHHRSCLCLLALFGLLWHFNSLFFSFAGPYLQCLGDFLALCFGNHFWYCSGAPAVLRTEPVVVYLTGITVLFRGLLCHASFPFTHKSSLCPSWGNP